MRDFFCGWYIKCQNERRTVALIPAYHITGGLKTCSLQVITDEGSWNVTYPYSAFHMDEKSVDIGGNHFSPEEITLDLQTSGLTASGCLTFGPFSPIRYDIMGPFKYVPFMECRHSVFSMKHTVNGSLVINGEVYDFAHGEGYVEGDRGYSFPREYVWTQCCFPEGSIMLSAADIPFFGFHFTGIISAIHFKGREYRIGTYLGARAVSIRDGEVVVRQGKLTLTVKRLEKNGHTLAAPVGGSMSRTIHETAACKVYFHLQKGGKTVFELTSDRAAFEYEYPR